MIDFQVDDFDLYFRYYLRRRNLSCSEYADLIGHDVRTIEAVANGELRPSMRIISDIRDAGYIVRCYPEKFRWSFERVIDEI